MPLNPSRGASGAAGVHIGTVTRVDGATCYVELPRIARGFEYGPARYPDTYAPDQATATAGGHGHDAPTVDSSAAAAHSHGAPTVDSSAVLAHDHFQNGQSTEVASGHTHVILGQASTLDGAHDHTMTVGAVPEAGGHDHAMTVGAVPEAGGHDHALGRPLAAGDTVAVAFLEDSRDELVVLVRLT